MQTWSQMMMMIKYHINNKSMRQAMMGNAFGRNALYLIITFDNVGG